VIDGRIFRNLDEVRREIATYVARSTSRAHEDFTLRIAAWRNLVSRELGALQLAWATWPPSRSDRKLWAHQRKGEAIGWRSVVIGERATPVLGPRRTQCRRPSTTSTRARS
jgi:hypothetical protein